MELIVDIKKTLPDFTLNVNFICSNAILGLLGESGSGKSMTLRCIAGLVKPDQGRIILNGRILFDSEKNINIPIKHRNIGLLFQNYALFPNMTVEKNIGHALTKCSSIEKKKIINDMLEMMQIEELRNRYPNQLSGGQQQRVALARALAVNPEALLLDEPFSALDNYLRAAMIKKMTQTLSNYHGASIFVTHNMEEAYQLCDKLVIVSKGRKVADGDIKSIFKNPPSVSAAKLTGCKNITSVKYIAPDLIEAVDWGCHLKLMNHKDMEISHIGIRAHYLQFNDKITDNTFNCWPVYTVEAPFRRMVYLTFNQKQISSNDFHLVWDISSEEWEVIKDKPTPWKIHFEEEKLIYIKEENK